MRLRLIDKPFDHPDYLFELKHDGFRAITYLQNGECKLISRSQNSLRFESLEAALAALPVRNAVLDGEICCLDEHGISQFNHLLNRKAEPIFIRSTCYGWMMTTCVDCHCMSLSPRG